MPAAPEAPAAQLMTAEALLQLPTGMGERYELVEGELKSMSPAGACHGKTVFRITAILAQCLAGRGLGEAFGAETGFTCPVTDLFV